MLSLDAVPLFYAVSTTSNITIACIVFSSFLYWAYQSFFHPLAKVPGPSIARLTSLWQIYHSYIGDEATVVRNLHQKYGKILRIGPNTVDIADGAALAPIYAEKGGFLKTSDYHNFLIDGYATIFSSIDPVHRGARAKVVASLFSNASIRRESAHLYECVERFVGRMNEMRHKERIVDLQDQGRLLGFDTLASYLFRREHPSVMQEASQKSIIPWLNSFVDAGQLYYFPSRFFGLLISILERGRPEKELEAQSAEDVHEWTTSLPMEGDEKADTYQARLFKSGVPKDQVAAECKDAIFAGTHSFGGVLATTLWYLVKHQDV